MEKGKKLNSSYDIVQLIKGQIFIYLPRRFPCAFHHQSHGSHSALTYQQPPFPLPSANIYFYIYVAPLPPPALAPSNVRRFIASPVWVPLDQSEANILQSIFVANELNLILLSCVCARAAINYGSSLLRGVRMRNFCHDASINNAELTSVMILRTFMHILSII